MQFIKKQWQFQWSNRGSKKGNKKQWEQRKSKIFENYQRNEQNPIKRSPDNKGGQQF
jgi:hypothetical protein